MWRGNCLCLWGFLVLPIKPAPVEESIDLVVLVLMGRSLLPDVSVSGRLCQRREGSVITHHKLFLLFSCRLSHYCSWGVLQRAQDKHHFFCSRRNTFICQDSLPQFVLLRANACIFTPTHVFALAFNVPAPPLILLLLILNTPFDKWSFTGRRWTALSIHKILATALFIIHCCQAI